jgi:hypothetical protein
MGDIVTVKIKRAVGKTLEYDGGEAHYEPDYVEEDKDIELSLQDYVDYYLDGSHKEVQETYEQNPDFKKGFREAIKSVLINEGFNSLDDFDKNFHDFIQDKYGD